MIDFLHTFSPDPIFISLGPVNIYWYGFFIVLGIIAAIGVAIKLGGYYGVNKDIIFDLAFWVILAGIAGARGYHVLLEFPYYLKHPLDILKIWQGGLAIHGAILAGIITIFFFSRKKEILAKSGFWLLAGIITPGLALAQSLGRWGNYFNQELFGPPTGLPWGIPIDLTHRPIEYISSEFFHPTFLYESIGDLIIFFILITVHVWIIKGPKNIMRYELCVTSYAILYSIIRFSLEFIRIDPTPTILGLRFPQIASLAIIAASIALLLKNKKNYGSIQ